MNRTHQCSVILAVAISLTGGTMALCASDLTNTVSLVIARHGKTGKYPRERRHADYVLYRFRGGELIGTELVLQTDNPMLSQPTLWESTACGDRYAVSSAGEIIDIIAKKRLFQMTFYESALAYDEERLIAY